MLCVCSGKPARDFTSRFCIASNNKIPSVTVRLLKERTMHLEHVVLREWALLVQLLWTQWLGKKLSKRPCVRTSSVIPATRQVCTGGGCIVQRGVAAPGNAVVRRELPRALGLVEEHRES